MPITQPSTLYADAFFMRRLAASRQLAATLPASIQFDISRAPYNNAQLEEVVGAFGATEGKTFGFAGLLEELLTSQPKKIAVKDIKTLQQNLMQQGYLPPDYEPTGQWDDDSYVAFSRFDRDSYEAMRQGKAFPAVPLEAGLRMIANTLPSRVFQGLVGMAKGLVEQTPETWERVGALGGAGAGAAIGAGIGSIVPGAGTAVGAGVGAVVGAGIGFFADLFGGDEGEEDQSALANVVDALTPWTEYKNNPNQFFEDLGYIGTVASITGGIGWGAKGFQAGRAAYAGAKATGMQPVQAALTRSAASVEAAAGGPTALANWITASPKFASYGWLQRMGTFIKGHSLTGRPIFQMANGLYTGASAASLGGRMAAGFDFGTGTAGTTTIEKAIKEAPLLQTGLNIGLPFVKLPLGLENLGDVVDLASFMIQPTRFFPFGISQVAHAANNLAGSSQFAIPFIHAIQHQTPGLSFRQAAGSFKEMFGGEWGAVRYTYRWLDHAINEEAARIITKSGSITGSPVGLKQVKARINKTILKEAEELGHSPLAVRLLSQSMQHPDVFAAELIRANGIGSGLERMSAYDKAVDHALEMERTLKDELFVELASGKIRPIDKSVSKVPVGAKVRSRLSGEEVSIPRPAKVTENYDKIRDLEIRRNVERLESSIKRQKGIQKRTYRPDLRGRLGAEISASEAQLKALKEELKAMREAATGRFRTIDEMRVGLMKTDEWTRSDFFAKVKEYKQLRKSLLAAQKAGDDAAIGIRRMEITTWLEDVTAEGYLPFEVMQKAVRSTDPGLKVSDLLTEQGRAAARLIEVPQSDAQYLEALGYKAVWTGEEVLYPTDIKTVTQLLELPEVSRVASFIETIGMGPRVRLEDDMWRLRYQYEVGELNEALQVLKARKELDAPFANGNEMLRFLSDYMREHNKAGVIHGPLVFEQTGKVHLYFVDSRQLTPEDILEAFEGKVRGIDIDAANLIYSALRRGAAYGGEFRFLHPIESARAMGRSMRINGAPGFSELIRTWHSAKDHFTITPQSILKGTKKYRPGADLARSKERSRFMQEMGGVAAKIGLKEGERQVVELLFDTHYRSLHALDPDAFPTPDSFYSGKSVEFARSYADTGGVGGYLQRVWKTPQVRTLVKLADTHSFKGDSWYQSGGTAIRAIFGGQKLTLRNHAVVAADDLFMRILAVTSGGELPKANLTKAMNVLQAYLENPTVPLKGLVRDIDTVNKVLDGWVPDSPKYGPFYRALMGDPDAVVIDRRMAFLMGFGPGFTPKESQFMQDIVRQVAKRSGVTPAVAQAQLWFGFADHFDSMAKKALREGNTELAQKFKDLADGVRKDPTGSESYGYYLGVSETKVVGPDGRPRRVYHGTTNEFAEFDLEQAQDGLYGPGIYFAEDPAVANKYTRLEPVRVKAPTEDAQKALEWMRSRYPEGNFVHAGKDPGPYGFHVFEVLDAPSNVHFSYLDIKNPFDTTKPLTQDTVRSVLKRMDDLTSSRIAEDSSEMGEVVRDILRGHPGGEGLTGLTNRDLYSYLHEIAGDEVNDVLRTAGYDGIFHIGERDGRVWVAFDPSQVHQGVGEGGGKAFGRSAEQAAGLRKLMDEVGATKVLGTDGQPLRVYHGTSHFEGDKFVSGFEDDATRVAGFYFTDSPHVASDWAVEGDWAMSRDTGGAPQVRAAFLDIRKPFEGGDVYDSAFVERVSGTAQQLGYDDAADALSELAQRLGPTGRVSGDDLAETMGLLGRDDFSADQVRQILKAEGYDGWHQRTTYHTAHHGEGHDTWVAFDEAQVHEGFVPAGPEELVQKYGLNPAHYAQIVEGQVRGMTEFGPDFRGIIRAFQYGDFGTMIHESGHLLRQMLPPKTRLEIEAAIGVRPITDTMEHFTPVPVRPVTDVHIDEMHARLNSEEHFNGFTFDPHTGEFLEGPAGYGVGFSPETGRVLPETATPAEIRAAVDEVMEQSRKLFGNERVKVGGWYDTEKTHKIYINPSEVIEDIYEAQTKMALRNQESAFDFRGSINDRSMLIHSSEIEKQNVAAGWTHEQEELFANYLTDSVMGTFSGKDAKLRSQVRRVLGNLYHQIRPWATDGGYIPNDLRAFYDKTFMSALQDVGIRRTPSKVASKQVAVGSTLGAAQGAIYGDDPGDVLTGALWGGAGGLVLKHGLSRTYGHLPDYLTRVNTALRYTFSFTFDAGRYSEQATIAFMKYGLRPTWRPRHFIMSQTDGWKTPFRADVVHGRDAWEDSIRLWDELMGGGGQLKIIDDTDRRLFQAGLLGFSPRYFEAAQAMQLYQRGLGIPEIKEAIANIGRYGLGRTNAEKTLNFVFFPFSFSKKLITTMGDFILQKPGRNLLITEGMRRYHESQLDEGFHDLVENHAPLLQQLWMVNNLAFGISPGRFFLEGLSDNRTKTGQAAQILASFFIPSGAATPLAKAAGGLGDLSINAFVPIAVTGESISRAGGVDGFDDLIRRYIPFVREVDTYAESFGEQWRAGIDPSHTTPWSQFQEYTEAARAAKEQYLPLALASGYSSVDGFFQSQTGSMVKMQYEQDVLDLQNQFPAGFNMSTSFQNTAAIDKKALSDLANKSVKSAGEEALLDLIEQVNTWEAMAAMGVMDPDVVDMILGSTIREKAMKYASDQRFAELYDRFLLREYGPIRRIA